MLASAPRWWPHSEVSSTSEPRFESGPPHMDDDRTRELESEISDLESQVEVAWNDYAAYRSRLEAKEAELEALEES